MNSKEEFEYLIETDLEYVRCSEEGEKLVQSKIEFIENQLDILEVISHYIEVKKMGSSYKACCPFHQEKTNSSDGMLKAVLLSFWQQTWTI